MAAGHDERRNFNTVLELALRAIEVHDVGSAPTLFLGWRDG
jgi:hypothetical protein